MSFMLSINTLLNEEYDGLLTLYWIPKLHIKQYRKRHNAGASICSTKELFINLANILSAVKGGLQSYCNKVYSYKTFHKMWKLKYCKDLLSSFYSRKFHLCKNWLEQFTNHCSWKCINRFKEIIYNAIKLNMVSNATNLYFSVLN